MSRLCDAYCWTAGAAAAVVRAVGRLDAPRVAPPPLRNPICQYRRAVLSRNIARLSPRLCNNVITVYFHL